MISCNPYSDISTTLLYKIHLEEETLATLEEIAIFAEDLNEHSQMILMQQRVVNFYKEIFAKVSTCTNVH